MGFQTSYILNKILPVKVEGINTKVLTDRLINTGASASSAWQKVEVGTVIAVVATPDVDCNYRISISWSWDGNGAYLNESVIKGTNIFIGRALVRAKAPFVRISLYNESAANRTYNAWIAQLNGSIEEEELMLAPFVKEQICAVANTEYVVDVNAGYGRNARRGWLKAGKDNAGTVSIAVTVDGLTYSLFFNELAPGDTISLDGENVDSIKVKSTAANDKIHVWVR